MALVRYRSDYRDERGTSLSSLTDEDFFEVQVVDQRLSEEGGKRKIMCVELALKRERAYAGKVAELLQLHQHHHNSVDDEKLCAPVQAPTLNLKPGVDRTPTSENLSVLPTPMPQQPYGKQTLQIQPSESISNLRQPQLGQTCPGESLQTRSSQSLSSLVPVSQPRQSYATQTQQSQKPSCLPPPQLQQSSYKKNIQSHPSENLSSLQPLQQHQSSANKRLHLQPALNLSCLPQPELQQPYAKQTPQIQSSQNLSCIPPTQLQQPYANQMLQIQSSENVLCIPPFQIQQSCAPPTFQIQSSRKRPVQLIRQSCAKRKFQMQPVSLVCKECQLPCSSATTLKQHYRGRKHRTRVEELRLQRHGIQTQAIQNVVTEPLWCEVCRIRCINEDCYLQHLKGKKHASCIQAISFAKAEDQVPMGLEKDLEWEVVS